LKFDEFFESEKNKMYDKNVKVTARQREAGKVSEGQIVRMRKKI
jgi:hypothetical protein